MRKTAPKEPQKTIYNLIVIAIYKQWSNNESLIEGFCFCNEYNQVPILTSCSVAVILAWQIDHFYFKLKYLKLNLFH